MPRVRAWIGVHRVAAVEIADLDVEIVRDRFGLLRGLQPRRGARDVAGKRLLDREARHGLAFALIAVEQSRIAHDPG